ncbi:MAG: PAS domain-containing protein [Pseudomonadota bacterium]
MELIKERVLLLDDEAQILVALEDLLGDEYTIFKSRTPERALELVRADPEIAVVITDQRMPHMNGDEFLSRIGGQSRALRIMVSGFADLPAVIRAVNDGQVFAYVTKPWDEEDLRLKVHTAVEHFRLAHDLEQERRLLTDLMDNSPDGIYFKDAELRFLRANQAFARSIGRRTANELVGRRLSELVDQQYEPGAREAEDRQVMRLQTPILDSVRRTSPNGKPSFTSETKAPISSPNGSLAGLVGISRDVTERVATSEALAESEARLKQQTQMLAAILDGMGEGVVVTARGGETLLFNREARRILGEVAVHAGGDEWATSYGLHQHDGKTPLPSDQDPVRRALSGESPVHLQLCVKRAGVASTLVALVATPLLDSNAAVSGAIMLLRDITQQHNLQQQVAQSQRMEAIGQLAGGIAHDFNNLLTVIVGCGELTLEDMPEGDPRCGNVAEILSAARHATLLTQQLLAFSRQQIIQPRDVQLNDVVTGIENILRRLTGDGVRIALVLDAGLGLICGDPSQFEQVLLNLVINARDAMPDGGEVLVETAQLTLNATMAASLDLQAGRFIALTVKDTGIGMTDETRLRLFEPFFTTKEFGKGTGLGLSTVYGIVQQNGGHISVQSTLGKGTEFRVLLPRTSRSIPPSAAAGERAPVAATILLIESDSAIRQLATKILRADGHCVLDVSRPGEARRILAQRASGVDVLLMDIGGAATELAAELVKQWPKLRVVLMTGGVHLSKQDCAPPLMPHALLAKPFSRKNLAEAIRRVLPATGASGRPEAPN